MSQRDMGLLQYLAALDREEEMIQQSISESQRALVEIQIAKKHARAVVEGGGVRAAKLPQGGNERDEGKPNKAHAPYAGMSNPAAALTYLKAVDKPQKTSQIAKALDKGGIDSKAKNFNATMFGTMKRLLKERKVVRVGPGLWALPEQHESNELALQA